MAVLSMVSATHLSNFSSFANFNKGNSLVTRRVGLGVGVPSVRRGSHLIKSSDNDNGVYVTTTLPEVKPETRPAVGNNSVTLPDVVRVKRSDFPADFLFGAGTSAVQTEGAYNEDGKGLSIWDVYAQQNLGATPNLACDSYHRYKDDIQLLKAMGVKTYRFSISWARILPKGSLKGGKNQDGIDHYNDLIDELKKNGIEPFVTLFHFDLPQSLEDKYGGLLSREFVNDFKDYANICFEEFGNRVKYWTAVNEAIIFAKYGYDLGVSPPGRGSLCYNRPDGNSAREPYIVAHHLILAQAIASRHYKENFQAKYQGEIGMSLVGTWFLPQSDSLEDQSAADRARDFNLGWFLGPLYNGDYPDSMRYLLRDRLPFFTDEEKKMVKGSIDFVGINYYNSIYCKALPITSDPPTSYSKDVYVELLNDDPNGVPIGPSPDGNSVIRIYPDGLRQILVFLKDKYQNPKLFVTENGVTSTVEHSPNHQSAFNDEFRIEYIENHLQAVKQALQEGANVNGYFYWSLLDSFEFSDGYNIRFGLNFTDFKSLERYPKLSAKWFGEFLKE